MNSKCKTTLVHKLKPTASCKTYFGVSKYASPTAKKRQNCVIQSTGKRKTEFSSVERSAKESSTQNKRPRTTKKIRRQQLPNNNKAASKKLLGQPMPNKIGAKIAYTKPKNDKMNSTNQPTSLTHSTQFEPVSRAKKQHPLIRNTEYIMQQQMDSNQYSVLRGSHKKVTSDRKGSTNSRGKKSKISKVFDVLIDRIKSNQKTMMTVLSEPRILQKKKFNQIKKSSSSKRKKSPLKVRQQPILQESIRLANSAQCSQLKCPQVIVQVISSKDERLISANDSRHQSIIKQVILQPSRIQNLFALQTQLSSKMRAVLIDWMFKISSQMGMQRQTVYLAITYLDKYTQSTKILKRQYQLFALAGFLVAYKQEYSSHDKFLTVLVTSSDNGYSRQDILEAERRLVLGLKFKLNPTSINFWLEYFTLRWDRFLEKGQFLSLEELGECKRLKQKPIWFRQPCPQAYNLYRQATQLIDSSVYCDRAVSDFDRPKLVIAALYLVLRAEMEFEVKFERMLVDSDYSKYQALASAFSLKASPILKDWLGFNAVFNDYIVQLCDFELADVVPEIKFMAGFLGVGFGYGLPEMSGSGEMTYDQFIRFQTYPPSSLQFVLARL